jgi:hypothetical protein
MVRLLGMASAIAMLAGLTRPAHATCSQAPCVDAEPMWLPPASTRFTLVSDATAAPARKLAAGAVFGFRLHPAVLSVPAPNQEGRDVNLLRYAVDASFGLRWGLGEGLELTVVAPAGLYQRGSGIKGITSQRAPALPAQSLHDPRLGFGYALATGSRYISAKLRFEAKLPLGNADALAGEASPVASPSFVLQSTVGHWAAGLELGARLRRPVDFYGARVGSQGLLAVGITYELTRPRLSFALEDYILPSLVARGSFRYLPAETLLTTRLAPASWQGLSFGLAGGTGYGFSSTPSGESALALGVPTFRVLGFVRYAPASR